MDREIPYNSNRQIDEGTLKDLLVIHIEQVASSSAISDAMNVEYSTPFSESIYDIVLDVMGAPDCPDFREPFYDLLYNKFLLESEFNGIDEFFSTLKFELDDHINMHKKSTQNQVIHE